MEERKVKFVRDPRMSLTDQGQLNSIILKISLWHGVKKMHSSEIS